VQPDGLVVDGGRLDVDVDVDVEAEVVDATVVAVVLGADSCPV
jgi:hypothetical protein